MLRSQYRAELNFGGKDKLRWPEGIRTKENQLKPINGGNDYFIIFLFSLSQTPARLLPFLFAPNTSHSNTNISDQCHSNSCWLRATIVNPHIYIQDVGEFQR